MLEDRKFLDLKEAKNDLETYCYEFRNNLAEGAIFVPHIDPGIKENFLKDVNEAVEWMYGAGENAVIEEYTKRYT
jgi:hypothetical protein